MTTEINTMSSAAGGRSSRWLCWTVSLLIVAAVTVTRRKAQRYAPIQEWARELLSTSSGAGGGMVLGQYAQPESTYYKQVAEAKREGGGSPPLWLETGDRTVPKFVFFVGVGGTGHHLYDSVVSASPSFGSIKDRGLHVELRTISRTLYNEGRKEQGLWSGVCAGVQAHSTNLFEQLVERINRLKIKVQKINLEGLIYGAKEVEAIPLNSAEGMLEMGYPLGYPVESPNDCSILQHPDLNSLFAACDRAHVRCEAVVAFRDPHEVIRSTTYLLDKTFASNRLQYIETLSLMLDRIRAQLLDHPDRIAACWDMDAPEQSFADVGKLFGWDDMDAISDFFSRNYNEHEPITKEERLEVVGSEMAVYMNSLVKAMEEVRKLCREQLSSRKDTLA